MNDKPNQLILNSRAELRGILQSAGLSRAAADAIAKGGWSALSDEPNPQDIKDLTVSIQALRERRATTSAALASLSGKPNWRDSVDKPKYEALMGEIAEIDVEVKRINDANERIANSVVSHAGNIHEQEHVTAFNSFLRAPKDMRNRQALMDIDFRNTAGGGTDPAGGFLVPDLILGPLMRRAVNANPFRDLVRVVSVASRDVNFPLSNSNSATGWVGETDARTATAEATLANSKPTFGTLYSYVNATEELVMDATFDIGNWFSLEAGDAMGAAEMTAIITGNGTNKPTGLLNSAPTTGADGSRAAGVFKYLPTGNAATLGAAPSDLLISTVYDLMAGYRANATWVMNSAVAGQIRQLKDGQGRFLWTDGIAAGQASTLLGYPVAIAESMPGVAANTLPIMFGDFSRAYILCDNGGLRVTVDDNVTTPGLIKWYLRKRLGGIVYDQNAVRVIKVSVT